MYGWRARIGIIVSPPNTVAEVEFSRMAPQGVTIHASRMIRPPHMSKVGVKTIEATNETLPQVAATLAPLRPGVLVFAHTLGSMAIGPGRDAEFAGKLSGPAGCPAITVAGAALAAFQALGVNRIALVAPYATDMVGMEKDYLEKSLPGLEVVNEISLGLSDGWEIGNLEPREAYRAAREVDRSEADAIFISGTNWRTIEAIEPLEKDLGKPIITGNQVGMWAALRELGIGGVKGFGRLFEGD